MNFVKRIDFYYDVTTISSWIMFERLNVTRRLCPSIEYNFRPVHYSSLLTSAGNLVPFSTAALRKNFFEQQRELARVHGITIGTRHGIIDDLLAKLSNTVLPQCFMNMVASERGHESLIELSRSFWRKLWISNVHLDHEEFLESLRQLNIQIPPDEIIFDNRWGKLIEQWHCELLNRQQCFDVPWTVLHFDNDTTKNFNSFDKWPLIASLLNIDKTQFGLRLPFK